MCKFCQFQQIYHYFKKLKKEKRTRPKCSLFKMNIEPIRKGVRKWSFMEIFMQTFQSRIIFGWPNDQIIWYKPLTNRKLVSTLSTSALCSFNRVTNLRPVSLMYLRSQYSHGKRIQGISDFEVIVLVLDGLVDCAELTEVAYMLQANFYIHV